MPHCAISLIRGPPGYGHPNILATLSKASQAASSNVPPSFIISSGVEIRYKSLCHQETVNTSIGNL